MTRQGASKPKRSTKPSPEASSIENAPVWELHRRPLPVRVVGESSPPHIIVCVDADSGFIFAAEAVPASAPPQRTVEVFLKAAASVGGLPSVVAVARDDLAELLRQALRSMGANDVEVRRVSSLPAVQQALRSMGRFVGFDIDWPEQYWRELARAYPDLPGLMRDAAAYYRAAPWELLDDDDILTARVRPQDGQRRAAVRYLSVLGGAGETFGLAVFHSQAGVRTVLNGDERAAVRVAMTFVTFGALEDAEPELKARLARRYEVAGPAAFPFFMRRTGGGQGRLPTAAEFDELRALLQAVTALTEERDRRADVEVGSALPIAGAVSVSVGQGKWDVELRS